MTIATPVNPTKKTNLRTPMPPHDKRTVSLAKGHLLGNSGRSEGAEGRARAA
jgi:hypothetical protein